MPARPDRDLLPSECDMPRLLRYILFYVVCTLILAGCAVAWIAMLSPYRMPPEMVREAQWAEVQAYQARGYVWVNTNSGLIWTPGSKWYGCTQQGEYMPAWEARLRGNRYAYGSRN